MIKNGGNGSFRVVFPLVRLVSSLQGFNSSGLHFLNLFNDPRIIWEQIIAANWVIENKAGVELKLDHLLERTQEQLDLSPFEGTQLWVVLKLKVNDKQFVEQMRFDDSNETGIHVMVEQMND
ncbi:hypothetical protein Tco_1284824 [Tanacetum coccineum]